MPSRYDEQTRATAVRLVIEHVDDVADLVWLPLASGMNFRADLTRELTRPRQHHRVPVPVILH